MFMITTITHQSLNGVQKISKALDTNWFEEAYEDATMTKCHLEEPQTSLMLPCSCTSVFAAYEELVPTEQEFVLLDLKSV